MQNTKKLDLKDAAIFVLFLLMFSMILPFFLGAFNSVKYGLSFYDELMELSLHGVLFDWAVIIAIFIGFLMEGRAKKKRLFMTFGLNRKTYYKNMIRENLIKAFGFAVIRTLYLFIMSGYLKTMISYNDNQREIDYYETLFRLSSENPSRFLISESDIPQYVKSAHFVYDTDMIHVPILYIFLSGFIIYMILMMSKDILDYISVSNKKYAAYDSEIGLKKCLRKSIGNKLIFVYVIITWLLCFGIYPLMYISRIWIIGDRSNYDYGIVDKNGWSVAGVRAGENPLDITLPNGVHIGYGTMFQLYCILIFIAVYVITRIIYRNISIKKEDWIDH